MIRFAAVLVIWLCAYIIATLLMATLGSQGVGYQIDGVTHHFKLVEE